MPRRGATEKRAGGSRGWRPQADEEAVAAQLPAPAAEGPNEDDTDDPVDGQQDYGVKIIWGGGERRPGARLEKIAARQR